MSSGASTPPTSHGCNSLLPLDSSQKFSRRFRKESEWNRTWHRSSIIAKRYPGGSTGSTTDMGRRRRAWIEIFLEFSEPFLNGADKAGANSSVLGDINA